MGFDRNSVKFLIGEKRRGLRFDKTLTLGHQSIYMDRAEYSNLLASLGKETHPSEFSDEFLAGLGCSELHIMDASNYEGAKIIHDLNEIAPAYLRQSFDCVIDGGTLEHVFNFPTAIRNCMEMVKEGGALILMTPWHNYSGHGLYQFSPELFYSALSEINGFFIERMLIAVRGRWYKVLDPAMIRGRVEIETSEPVMLYITARRRNSNPIFNVWPQQSDYMAAWSSEVKPANTHKPKDKITLKDLAVDYFASIRLLQSKWRKLKRRWHLAPRRNRALELLPDHDGEPLC